MKQRIIEIITEVGIKDVGFCAFSQLEDKLIDCRAKNRIPQNAKTVITCLFPYKVREAAPQNISRYAAVPDYHKVCGEYLRRACAEVSKYIDGYQFDFFIDNSPIPEVYAAAISGLGVIGKNGLLINKKYGSFVFIGEIITDLDLRLDNKTPKNCKDCGICMSVCPKGILGDCLSNISQKKGELEAEELAALQKHNIVWGCDICSEVCPENKDAQITYIKEFIDGYRDKFCLGEDISGRAYEWRGEKPVMRNLLNLEKD
ncbi:MAG: DUF1730 domain-containing protein [Oscillospiraceae bacterium]|nr:DUF1730 domain-containing protein [Oscillospiraceae bacterium]